MFTYIFQLHFKIHSGKANNDDNYYAEKDVKETDQKKSHGWKHANHSFTGKQATISTTVAQIVCNFYLSREVFFKNKIRISYYFLFLFPDQINKYR